MSLRGMLLRLSYRLGRHYIGSLPVGTWVVLAGLAVVALGLFPKITISPGIMVAAGFLALVVLSLLVWGRVTRFLRFDTFGSDSLVKPSQQPMQGLDHVKLLATGKFSVEGKERFFASLEAIYHSFESREHAVMAHVPISRFLLLAQSPKLDVGMWYIFFKPEHIVRVERGVLEHGERAKMALRCVYRGEKRLEEVYLAFEREEDLWNVAADLAYDAPDERATDEHEQAQTEARRQA